MEGAASDREDAAAARETAAVRRDLADRAMALIRGGGANKPIRKKSPAFAGLFLCVLRNMVTVWARIPHQETLA